MFIDGEKISADRIGLINGPLKYILIVAGAGIACIVFVVSYLKSSTIPQQTKTRNQTKLAAGEVVCSYCNTTYNANQNSKCPYCGGKNNL